MGLDLISRYRNLLKPRVVGLMSGTSLDAIDAVLVEMGQERPRFIRLVSCPLDSEVRVQLLKICRNESDVWELTRMHWFMGELLAEAVEKLKGECEAAGDKAPFDLIASHGQTVCHLPVSASFLGHSVRGTLQIGEGAVIAERTGCLTVCDFRPQDLALGGQGAPLVPFADQIFFHSPDVDRIALNIGGMANITYIPKCGECLACDTGPGNALCDRAAEVYLNEPCDRDGRLASSGSIIPELLSKLAESPFLRMPAPKSTGREEFGADLADRIIAEASKQGWEAADVMRTLAAFTAYSIALHVNRAHEDKDAPCEILSGGGGIHNRAIMQGLRERLDGRFTFKGMESAGVPPQAREAMAFALFGHYTVLGKVSNLPSCTGAVRSYCLGKIVLP